MSDWLDVILLGIVEGLTEFLPISSTAHLLIVANLLGFRNDIGGTFEIFIQLGAILAVLGFYARDLLAQVRAVPSDAATGASGLVCWSRFSRPPWSARRCGNGLKLSSLDLPRCLLGR